MGSTWPFDHVLDATTAEAIIMLRGMEFLESMGCSPTTVESDYLEHIHPCIGIKKIGIHTLQS